MLCSIKTFLKTLIRTISTNIPSNTLRIVGIEGCPDEKNTHINYQICGKSVVSQEPLDDLISELGLVKGFSKTDSDHILGLFVTENRAPAFKIKSVIFSEYGDEFEIEDIKDSNVIRTTANSLFETPEILGEFHYLDILMIQHSHLSAATKAEKISMTKHKLIKPRGHLSVINNQK